MINIKTAINVYDRFMEYKRNRENYSIEEREAILKSFREETDRLNH